VAEDTTITSVSLGRGGGPSAAPEAPQLVMLMVCDDPSVASSRHLLAGLDEVRFGRGPRQATRTTIGGVDVLELRIPDRRMSSDHGRLVRGPAGWVLEDPSSKNGSVIDGSVTRRAVVPDGATIELGHSFFRFATGPVEDDAPLDLVDDEPRWPAPTLATFAGPLAQSFAALARVAPTKVSVVLFGETGTGKEVVARAVHEMSGRPGPFVALNCGALPGQLIEAELFGHRRGAFSGAVTDRPGLVRSADAGTLFLDEIGELPVASQTAFLRVLQEEEVVPVGDDRPVRVDVRICAATLRDLDALVDSGGFRRDLYARLFGVTIELPPLRARMADLGLLIRALLPRIPGGDRVRITPAAMRLLVRHDWPLNVRELDKALASATALSTDGVIEPAHLPTAIRRGRRPAPDVPALAPAAAPAALTDDDLDADDRALRDRLVELLVAHHGNVLAVSDALGKRRMQIYRWAKRFRIDLDAYRK
jgi:sigma-54 dependent transcriptional regulator, acetoin dehydrogenase operon transcriptional activator AcoR